MCVCVCVCVCVRVCSSLHSDCYEFCVENSRITVSYPFFHNPSFLFCFFFVVVLQSNAGKLKVEYVSPCGGHDNALG